MIRLALLVWIVVGCSGPEETPQTADVPYLYPATDDPDPVDLDAVAAAVDAAVIKVLELDATPIQDAYRNAMAGSDAACPSFYTADGVEYWLATCSAGSGTSFDGYAIDDELLAQLEDTTINDYFTLGGIARIEQADGTFLEMNGFAQTINSVAVDGSYRATTVILSGEFATNDAAAIGTWLDEGLEPNIFISDFRVPGIGGMRIVSGVLAGLPGAYPTVVFDESALAVQSLGNTDCELEPTGVVSVQLDTGKWVDIIFDPKIEGDFLVTDDAASCDGCGRAWLGTAELGQACFDFSAWL